MSGTNHLVRSERENDRKHLRHNCLESHRRIPLNGRFRMFLVGTEDEIEKNPKKSGLFVVRSEGYRRIGSVERKDHGRDGSRDLLKHVARSLSY